MLTRVIVLVLFVAALGLGACQRIISSTPVFKPIATEQTVINRINELRTEHGLKPLTPTAQLTHKAEWWSAQMAQGACGHLSSGAGALCHSTTVEPLQKGITAPWTWLGENVGICGGCSTVAPIQTGFEHSPEHLANILHANATSVGVGIAWWHNYGYLTEEFLAP